MTFKNTQFTIIHHDLKTTPLIPWKVVGKLMWDLTPRILNKMDEIARKYDWHFNYFVDGYSHSTDYSVIITGSDLKIVFASKNIEDLTGYDPYEMVGQTPKILQGVNTDLDAVERTREALISGIAFKARLLNYKKDGVEYGCELDAFPIYNGNGVLTHHIAFEKEYKLI
ncbi:PAS/PAC domain protein [Nonlabens tegetincola]|uniref:PAS/PAC domain protein n=1 Tax=Nonlabens tegetincola TaxID=323273 RepID=A0A090Q0N2_9FLAO|nr:MULTISPECIES: PAS domain-containing protein [Nonlabens]ARN72342.1 hypothetical protein BST91_12050 [Nonlabens tegetincola]PQJ20041.1 hypothetical protein BST93_00945 [Nonlabens tegetincola]GAK95742.1 PAS/PAC domain protein [Nonlabens tegetincola]